MLDPGHRVRQTRRAQLRGCWRALPDLAVLDRPLLVGTVAQVVPAGGARARCPPADARLGDGGGGYGGGARGRPRRARPRGAPRWCRWSRVADEIAREAARFVLRTRATRLSSEPSATTCEAVLDDPAPHRVVGCRSTSSSSSVVIYEILKLIRGTRAVQMAFGVALLSALFYLSRLGHLETVNWLIRNMVGYVVFALIVLFQADIRRALAHFGRTPFVGLLRAAGRRRRGGRGDGGRGHHAGRAAHRRDHRDRARHRPAQLHRGRHPARCHGHLRPAGQHLPARRPRCTTARSSCRATASPPPPASCR